MLKIIAIAIVVILAGILIYAATRPDTFRIERSATMLAPANSKPNATMAAATKNSRSFTSNLPALSGHRKGEGTT